MERIDATLRELMRRQEAAGDWDWALVAQASTDIGRGLAQREEQMESYYTPEQIKRFEELGREVPREEIVAIEQSWTALLAEVRAARDGGLDSASVEASELAARWDRLSDRTLAHFPPDLRKAIGTNYEQGSFEGHARAPQLADFAWIEQVKAAVPQTGG